MTGQARGYVDRGHGMLQTIDGHEDAVRVAARDALARADYDEDIRLAVVDDAIVQAPKRKQRRRLWRPGADRDEIVALGGGEGVARLLLCVRATLGRLCLRCRCGRAQGVRRPPVA